MWRGRLNNYLREIRISGDPLRSASDGVYAFVNAKLPELRLLNPDPMMLFFRENTPEEARMLVVHRQVDLDPRVVSLENWSSAEIDECLREMSSGDVDVFKSFGVSARTAIEIANQYDFDQRPVGIFTKEKAVEFGIDDSKPRKLVRKEQTPGRVIERMQAHWELRLELAGSQEELRKEIGDEFYNKIALRYGWKSGNKSFVGLLDPERRAWPGGDLYEGDVSKIEDFNKYDSWASFGREDEARKLD